MEVDWQYRPDPYSITFRRVIFYVPRESFGLPTEQVVLEIFLRYGEYLPGNFGVSGHSQSDGYACSGLPTPIIL